VFSLTDETNCLSVQQYHGLLVRVFNLATRGQSVNHIQARITRNGRFRASLYVTKGNRIEVYWHTDCNRWRTT